MEQICKAKSKTIESYLRAIAGVFLVVAVVLHQLHSPNWIWFIMFIGLNLLQSSFTNWCPMISILEKVFKVETRAH